MIRHRPSGSGHPYVVDTEQRDPVVPVAGQPLTLGVRTAASVEKVVLEWRHDGVAQPTRDLVQVPRSSRGRALDDGHLASAQTRPAGGGWVTTLDGLRPHATVRYRFVTPAESTAWFEVQVAAWTPGANIAEQGNSRILPGTTASLADGERTYRVRFALPLQPGERVVGFGERYDRIDQRGTTLDSVVFEQYKDQGRLRRTYFPMPFAHVVGGQGWGFAVRTARRVWFDVGAAEPDLLRVEAETGPDGALEVVLYDGTPAAVLAAFLAEVGSARELPDWVFRLWASGNEWNTQAEVMRQADAHRDHDIPLGAIVIEAWSDESTFTQWRDSVSAVSDQPKRLADFEFPPGGAWPDPKGMVSALHERDIRVVLWQIPLIKTGPHATQQARVDAEAAIREGVLIREPAGDGRLRPYRNRGGWFPSALMPDLSDDRAAHWWTEKRRYLVDEVGIDGFKTDGGEHAWGRELVYLDGRLGDEKNNEFPVAYARAYGDLLRRCGRAPVTFSRAGYVGSQAFGAFWAGDENSTWAALRWSLHAGLNAAACGVVYWGWDLAGFSAEVPTAELYLRATAAATFVPIMQYHSEFNHHRRPSRDRTPWNIAERSGDERVIPVFRAFAQLRQRLVPYLTASAREAIARRAPLMRPLFLDHPNDPAVWDHPLQWMLGDALLVAPVTAQGAQSVSAYLPAGAWRDAFSGDAVEGGRVIARPTPLDEVAVWVRAADWMRLKNVLRPPP